MEVFAKLVSAVLALIAISVILSWFVMLLWNGCLVPAVDGVNPVTWLQALGLSVLFSFLFKSTGTSK
jgi:hypothetical protein